MGRHCSCVLLFWSAVFCSAYQREEVETGFVQGCQQLPVSQLSTIFDQSGTSVYRLTCIGCMLMQRRAADVDSLVCSMNLLTLQLAFQPEFWQKKNVTSNQPTQIQYSREHLLCYNKPTDPMVDLKSLNLETTLQAAWKQGTEVAFVLR